MAGKGTFSITVWPVYIGVALQGATPPFTLEEPHNGGYQRGQITWTPVPDDRQVIGRARILLPAGVYSHFLYFHHPTRPQICGLAKMDHPLRCTEPVTVLDVDPILNGELQLAQQLGG